MGTVRLYQASAIGIMAGAMIGGGAAPAAAQPYSVAEVDFPDVFISNLVGAGDRLFFQGQAATQIGTHPDGFPLLLVDSELWVSDGSIAGTQKVADINTESGSPQFIAEENVWVTSGGSSPRHLVAWGDNVAFSAIDDGDGGDYTPWFSDGSSAGTVQLDDAATLNGPFEMTPVGLHVYYYTHHDNGSYDAFYASDGSAGSAAPVPGVTDAINLAAAGNQLYFSAVSGAGREPFVLTAGGSPVSLGDLNPTGSSDPTYFTPAGSSVYFLADSDDSSAQFIPDELWKTNGTALDTEQVLSAGPNGDAIEGVFGAGGGLVMITTNTSFESNVHVVGDDGSTQLIPGVDSPERFTVVGDTIYWVGRDASDPTAITVWSSDGTAAGSALLDTIDLDSGPIIFQNFAFGDRFIFATSQSFSGLAQLWLYDPALGDTFLLDSSTGGASAFDNLATAGGTFYYTVFDGSGGQTLMRVVPEPATAIALLTMGGTLLARRRGRLRL